MRPFVYFVGAQEINNSSGAAPSSSSAASTNGNNGLAPANGASPSQPMVISLSGAKPGALRYLSDEGITGGIYGHVGGLAISAEAHFDDMLLQSEHLLNELHSAYYTLYDSDPLRSSTDDMRVPSLLGKLKARVLSGVSLAFSGVIPKSDFPETHPLWRLAKALGARVTSEVVADTTHLVTTQVHPRTQKLVKCITRDNVYIVHTDWLQYCRYTLARADETTFSLIPGIPSFSGASASSSAAAVAVGEVVDSPRSRANSLTLLSSVKKSGKDGPIPSGDDSKPPVSTAKKRKRITFMDQAVEIEVRDRDSSISSESAPTPAPPPPSLLLRVQARVNGNRKASKRGRGVPVVAEPDVTEGIECTETAVETEVELAPICTPLPLIDRPEVTAPVAVSRSISMSMATITTTSTTKEPSLVDAIIQTSTTAPAPATTDEEDEDDDDDVFGDEFDAELMGPSIDCKT